MVFCALVVCAIAAVTARTVAAATPAKVWKEQDQSFRLGYLVGFFDAANISRQLHPMDYMDTTFPLIEGADPYVMEAAIRDIYAQDEFADANVIKALVAALGDLGKTHTVVDGAERFRRRWIEMKGGPEALARLEEEYRRKQALAAANKGDEAAVGEPGAAAQPSKPPSASNIKKKKKEASKPTSELEKLRVQVRSLRREKARERGQAWINEAQAILKEQGMLGPEGK